MSSKQNPMPFVLSSVSRLHYSLFLLLLPFFSAAQSPYEVKPVTEGIIAGVSAGFFLYSRNKAKNQAPFTKEDISLLDANDVFAFDRSVTNRWSKKSQKASDLLLQSAFIIPATLFISGPARKDVSKIGLFYLETLLINTALTDFSKGTVSRARPYVYNMHSDVPFDLKLKRDARRSFFSGHTSTTAAMSFLSAKMYSDYHPNSDAKPFVWGAAVLIPAATGYLRTRAGKHFYTDVLTGFAVGAAIGILIPQLHKR